ncbi:MAG: hypothetical protein HY775_07180 [Acidobacteria bacterium]|nr:hypothetical protein [Acidobacteriota bacterium]
MSHHHPRFADSWEWDDDEEERGNTAHLSAKGISVAEVGQVWEDGPEWARNKKGGSADWVMFGRTTGGRALLIVVAFYEDRGVNRAVTGRDAKSHEVERYF